MNHDFLSKAAQTAVTDAVRAVEKQAEVELVVAVRPLSGHYRHIDYLVGALTGLAALCVLLFAPMPFRLTTMPIDVVLLFALGAAASSYSPGLRRVLSRRALRQKQVHTAAEAAFVELGISRTHHRTGMLVFVSLLERRVELVADIGLDAVKNSPAFVAAQSELTHAVEAVDQARFVAALTSFGKCLTEVLPRVDELNELPDAPSMEN